MVVGVLQFWDGGSVAAAAGGWGERTAAARGRIPGYTWGGHLRTRT